MHEVVRLFHKRGRGPLGANGTEHGLSCRPTCKLRRSQQVCIFQQFHLYSWCAAPAFADHLLMTLTTRHLFILPKHSAAMSAKLNRHSVDTRMTPQARRELTLAQREVMWNLQREAVVTIVRPGDDPVPYKRQGNPAVNTPQCVRRRHALRKNSLIQVRDKIWLYR